MSDNTLVRQIDAMTNDAARVLEEVVIKGDLANLAPEQRADYYALVCRSVGLNPFTKPFEYIKLNGKLTLYALKGATDQLRDIKKISISEPKVEFQGDWIIVTVTGTTPDGRTDSEIGVCNKSENGNFANAIMKTMTKAKRRLTLSMCGLGMLDETEVETIPGAERPATPQSVMGANVSDQERERNAVKAMVGMGIKGEGSGEKRRRFATDCAERELDWVAVALAAEDEGVTDAEGLALFMEAKYQEKSRAAEAEAEDDPKDAPDEGPIDVLDFKEDN